MQVVCRYLCEETNENLTEKEFIPAVRSFALKLILAGNTGWQCFVCGSLNCFHTRSCLHLVLISVSTDLIMHVLGPALCPLAIRSARGVAIVSDHKKLILLWFEVSIFCYMCACHHVIRSSEVLWSFILRPAEERSSSPSEAQSREEGQSVSPSTYSLCFIRRVMGFWSVMVV